MAKDAKTDAQIKGRQTKLGKKSSEELIQIILRKDKTEHNLNAQVVKLKTEVNSLTSRINNFEKDMEGTLKAIANWRQKYAEKSDMVHTLNESIAAKTSELQDYKELYKKSVKTNVERTTAYNSLKKVTWAIAGFAAICLIGWIFC